jgi:ABC-type oligopeptide transport system substrate-binding subunit
MNVFGKKFFTLINEEETINPDQEALGLDPGTPEGTFDDVDPNPMVALQKQQTFNTIGTLETWIGSVSEFITFLNGLDESSMNMQINKADCDSILADVQRSESKKISRLAQDLSSLEESLKQYLIVANNKTANAGTI